MDRLDGLEFLKGPLLHLQILPLLGGSMTTSIDYISQVTVQASTLATPLTSTNLVTVKFSVSKKKFQPPPKKFYLKIPDYSFICKESISPWFYKKFKKWCWIFTPQAPHLKATGQINHISNKEMSIEQSVRFSWHFLLLKNLNFFDWISLKLLWLLHMWDKCWSFQSSKSFLFKS